MRILLLFLSLSIGSFARAQSNPVEALVDSENFVFKAQSALPGSGPARNLPPDYDLEISKTSVASYLPYYGDASISAIAPGGREGLEFTSKNFTYTFKPGKKDGWVVTLVPKDYKDVSQMTLTISGDGSTTLLVLLRNRQPISFNGVIAEPDKSQKP
jgi:hypothetical protein